MLGDLSSPSGLEDVLGGAEIVIHAAARAHIVDERETNPLAAYRRVNVAATAALAHAAVEAGVGRVVLISSIGAVGDHTGPGQSFTEQTAPAPADAYGLTKLEAETALWSASAGTSMVGVVIRPPLVCGPDAKGNLARLMRLVASGMPLPLGGVTNRRSLIGLDNLVSAIRAAAEHPAAAGRTFLVSDQDDLSTPELLRRIAAALGQPARLWPLPPSLLWLAAAAAGRRREFDRLTGSPVIDSSAITRDLGWLPPFPAKHGIEAMARAFGRSRDLPAPNHAR